MTGRNPASSGRAVALALTALVVLGALTAPVAVAAGEGPVYETDTGLRVIDADDTEPFPTGAVFPDEETVSLAAVTLSANGTGAVTVDDQAGAWTNLSAIDAPVAVTVDPDDKPAVTVGGGVDSLSFGSIGLGANSTDVVYDAASNWTLTVPAENRSTGTTVRAVDGASKATLATATVENGSVTFALPAGTGELRFAVAAGTPDRAPVAIDDPTSATPATITAGSNLTVGYDAGTTGSGGATLELRTGNGTVASQSIPVGADRSATLVLGASVPSGTYDLRLIVTDAAGERRTVTEAGAVTVEPVETAPEGVVPSVTEVTEENGTLTVAFDTGVERPDADTPLGGGAFAVHVGAPGDVTTYRVTDAAVTPEAPANGTVASGYTRYVVADSGWGDLDPGTPARVEVGAVRDGATPAGNATYATRIGNVSITAAADGSGGLPPEARAYDGDGDGDIAITELGDAAADYASDELTIAELADVAAAYVRSG